MTSNDWLEDRSQLGKWLTDLCLDGQGVEVGVLSGENARNWISTWKGHLYCVDPWAPQDPRVYKERQDWTDFEACYKECQKLAEQFYPRVTLLRMLSEKAMLLFPDESLDTVYVDGNHAYESAMADFDGWWAKIKPGGVLGAHDYWNDTTAPAWGEVKRVVQDWSKKMGLKFHHTPKCGSVWFFKP